MAHMENREMQLYSSGKVPLKVVAGHFATNHSHINYYIDMTTLKTRQSEAQAAAKALVAQYMYTTEVDTVVCLDGTQVIGAFFAEELVNAGFTSRNTEKSISIITPEYNNNGQLFFRDNLHAMLREKNVILLMASVTTGLTISRGIECIQYYGGSLQGISAIFSDIEEMDGFQVNAVFNRSNIPDYQTYGYHECPFCKNGIKLEALVNSYGYSKL